MEKEMDVIKKDDIMVITPEERACTEGLLEFIEKSPCCFHAVANVIEELKANGYQELRETEEWNLQPGVGYYVVRNDSSLIAIQLPKETKGFHIVASHSDSPSFKVKENPEMILENHYVKLNTEKYGGMILSTWMDRPLSVAGRLVVEDDGACKTILVNVDKDLLVIPNVAIHLNRDMNKGVEYNPQVDMLPLYADCGVRADEQNDFLGMLAKEADVEKDRILAHDLFLYVRDKGRRIGAEGEYVLSPRLDDLQCVYASMQAFLAAKPKSYVNICAVFDNEEVGSGTRQGADSTFL